MLFVNLFFQTLLYAKISFSCYFVSFYYREFRSTMLRRFHQSIFYRDFEFLRMFFSKLTQKQNSSQKRDYTIALKFLCVT